MNNGNSGLVDYAIIADGNTVHFTWASGLFAATLAARARVANGADEVSICVPDSRLPSGLRAVKTVR